MTESQSPSGSTLLSVADQAIVSGSNFAIGVMIANEMSASDFGTYGLLFQGLMIALGLQASLNTGPMRVLGVGKGNSFITAQRGLQKVVGLLLATLVLTASLAAGLDLKLSLVFAIAVALMLAHEFRRVTFFVDLDILRLITLDSATHLFRLLAIGVCLYIFSSDLVVVWLIIAISCLNGLASGSKTAGSTENPLVETARSNWRYGRWLVLESIVSTASIGIYLYLLAAAHGSAAVAGLNAVLILTNVFNIMLIGITQPAVTHARRHLIENRRSQWAHQLQRTAFLLAALGLATSIGLMMLGDQLLALLFGEGYARYADLVPYMALVMTLNGVNTIYNLAFRSLQLPQIGFFVKSISAVITLSLGSYLVSRYGALGAAIGMLTSQLIWLAAYSVFAMCTEPLQRIFPRLMAHS